MKDLIGRTVHVADASPRGWVGRVRSLTGTVFIIMDIATGRWHFVDHTRQKVTPR